MNAPRLLALAASVIVFTLHAEPVPEAAPDAAPLDPREAAKREAWRSAVLIISLLEQGDNRAFPSIRAWLEDFHQIAATTPPPESGKPFPALDTDALVTRNPHFWSAFYEVQPGDPGLALLHSALLLSGGEAQRASALAAFGLQRPAIPEEIKRGLTSVIAHCQSAQAHSAQLVRLGVKLHDLREYAAALKQFDAALEEWPANGCASYERGSTLRMQAIAEARLKDRGNAAASTAEAPPDPPETAEFFARARRHDPLHLLAYQGDNPAMLAGLLALVRSGLPVWETMRKHPEQPLKAGHLRDFSEACRAAAIDDFALVLRQLVVASNKRYSTEDRDVISESLGRLAPTALTAPLLARIGGDTKLPTRQIVVPLAVEPPEVTAIAHEETPAKDAKKSNPDATMKHKGKSATAEKSEASSSKTKRKRTNDGESEKPAKKSKTKKRKS